MLELGNKLSALSQESLKSLREEMAKLAHEQLLEQFTQSAEGRNLDPSAELRKMLVEQNIVRTAAWYVWPPENLIDFALDEAKYGLEFGTAKQCGCNCNLVRESA